ncbi:hypothetical protein WR25_26434 [Diploscapter pachys]|uniref:Trehalase n=1 Tax=Diploscapter pachys TaxID=2018661 RepID=A0A2A2JLE2_9BILA|nr:hypothetical protein WR25_26434 [Diploscapter pachys]
MLYAVLTLLSQIYCDGPILKTVQDSHMFPDSKYFVDMPLKLDPITTLRHFDELGEKAMDIAVLREFVFSHFSQPGTELVEVTPPDWVEFPSNFLKIHDYHHRRWALHLHRIWKDLCRKVKDDVRTNQDRYSLLYVPHPFIIPGGRFREFYYWDTFWILKGLIFSEMYETARGVIKNLAYMVDNHGFVPNGGRVYYLTRSQPPLLIPMVYDYFLGTGDLEFVLEILPTLEKEYQFWVSHRSTMHYDANGTFSFPFYQYKATLKVPRPESYREDYELVNDIEKEEDRIKMWSEVASAAETGWDFSTRWFSQNGDSMHKMHTIRTWSVVPVDLNAFMCVNSRILASFHEIAGDINKQHSTAYYASNAIPLYAKCFDDDLIPYRVHDYLKREGVMNFTKGLPTSLAMGSEQQWDKENAWPPMVHMVIEGFRTTGNPELMEIAKKMATGWLRVSYQLFIRTHAMFEKYNVTIHSDEVHAGSGGEYEVQTGFGWSNGVVLDLLDKYGDEFFTGGADFSEAHFPLTSLFLALIASLFNFLFL